MDWRRWSTADVATDHHDYWVDVIRRGVVAASLEGTTDHFSCSLASRCVDDARFIHFTVSGQHRVRREGRHAGASDDRYYMIGLQVAGDLRIDQGDERLVASPGNLVALHSGYPFELTFTEAIDRRVVLMPRSMLDRFLPKRSVLGAGRPFRFPATLASVRAASDLVRHLTDTSEAWDKGDCETTLEGLAQLLGGAVAQTQRRREPAAARLRPSGRGIETVIRRRAAEFDLSPALVARQLRISVRTLHRLLARDGLGFSRCLLDARLDRAHDLLQEAEAAQRTLTAIAMETGFCDAAHFSRTFARKFGHPPSKLRAVGRA